MCGIAAIYAYGSSTKAVDPNELELQEKVVFINRGRILESAPAKAFFEAPENDLAQAFVRGELLWWEKGKDNRKQQGKCALSK